MNTYCEGRICVYEKGPGLPLCLILRACCLALNHNMERECCACVHLYKEIVDGDSFSKDKTLHTKHMN